MTVDEKTMPTWLPNGCPAWCENPGFHRDHDRYADRNHTSKAVYVDLTAEEPPRDHGETFDDPECTTVYLIQHYREVEPRIWTGKGDTGEGFNLTLDEAEELADQLYDLVTVARQECGPRE